jgi:hypothetical protein
VKKLRAEYPLQLVFNGRTIRRVVISQHYRENHAESMSDLLILELVKTLNGGNYPLDGEDDGFQYFTVEPVVYQEKPYRVILVLCMSDDFLGVVNAFRVNI